MIDRLTLLVLLHSMVLTWRAWERFQIARFTKPKTYREIDISHGGSKIDLSNTTYRPPPIPCVDMNI